MHIENYMKVVYHPQIVLMGHSGSSVTAGATVPKVNPVTRKLVYVRKEDASPDTKAASVHRVCPYLPRLFSS